MCGILVTANTGHAPAVCGRALDSMTHRGPDDRGEWRSPSRSAWLGHRRLTVVDLTDAGRQPLSNEDGSIRLVCNGEIYNFRSLRARLESAGHVFRSCCDSEVIVHAYEAWGDACVEHLEGMFAFALWDEPRRRLLTARDRVGIKPLYYAQTGGGLILGSELRAILPLMDHPPDPDATSLAYVMTLGYVPSPRSIWEGIQKLEAGHMLTWSATRGARLRRYWEPPREIDEASAPDACEWESLFSTVLEEHLLSDVPVGLFLSGGLDSSSVAAGLHDLGRSAPAVTLGYPDSADDESPVASAVCERLGLAHTCATLRVGDVDRLLVESGRIFDEPQGYSALLSMLGVCEAAAGMNKVMLAGDGGDEVFGGYAWYRNLEPTTSPLHRHARRLYPRFLPKEARFLLAPQDLRFGDEEYLYPLRKHFEPALPLRRALQRVDLMTFCTDSILTKVDRAAMAHSLEVRVPFLDRRIIEWAMALPVSDRDREESKPILRDYVRPRVPASVLDHPKQGFSLRVLDRFDWDGAVDRIEASWWVQSGFWNRRWRELVTDDVPYRTGRIWNLLMLTHWADAWLGCSAERDLACVSTVEAG